MVSLVPKNGQNGKLSLEYSNSLSQHEYSKQILYERVFSGNDTLHELFQDIHAGGSSMNNEYCT